MPLVAVVFLTSTVSPTNRMHSSFCFRSVNRVMPACLSTLEASSAFFHCSNRFLGTPKYDLIAEQPSRQKVVFGKFPETHSSTQGGLRSTIPSLGDFLNANRESPSVQRSGSSRSISVAAVIETPGGAPYCKTQTFHVEAWNTLDILIWQAFLT